MGELKRLSAEGIEPALEKVERYRLLNEPWEAESICRDVLAADPRNQRALIGLVLSLTDQFSRHGAPGADEVRRLLDGLDGEYQRAYYAGIICERQAKAQLARGNPGAGYAAHSSLRQAMEHYEEAERLAAAADDSALLRWNTCARMIDRFEHVRPPPEEPPTMLE